jgi:hypothetical protein
MSNFPPLQLVALASKADESLVPPPEQVTIFTGMLGYICKLKPQSLPERPFKRLPCPSSVLGDLNEGLASKGIDFLGLYECGANEITVTLYICRILKFCAVFGFEREDAVKIVLIHELAHFVTHLGTASGAYWDAFSKEDSSKKEDVAQEATHLLLRVAGYGHLIQVFDALSQLCPSKYDSWRTTWQDQLKRGASLDSTLSEFRTRLQVLRPTPTRGFSHGMEDY